MTGQREKITYCVIVRIGRSGAFLPPHGVGYGLGEGLGIGLNRTVKGPARFRPTHQAVTGTVVAEDADHVTVEQKNGKQFRIPTKDIISRTVTHY